jgi:ATP-dependent Lon protease
MVNFTIAPEQLRWTPGDDSVKEKSTRKAPQSIGVVGQSDARQALKLALTSQSWHHNAYLRGSEASGRRALVHSLLDELKPAPRRSLDFCYVHNFAHPDRPRLIVLPGGQGRHFQQAMTRISLFVRDRLPEILKNDPIRSRREARKEAAEREIRHKIKPVEARLAEDGLALMRTQSGPTSRVSIYPQVMGKTVSPEEYRNLVTQGQAREEDRLKALKKAEHWQPEVNRFAHEINQIWQQAIQHIDQINATETARILGEMTTEVAKRFRADGLDIFLREIIDDIVEKRVRRDTSHLADPTLLYGVNVLTARADRKKAPTVYANQPSVANLFGTIDPAWLSGNRAVSSFRGIRTGSLLEADGGFLILDAADLISEPGCWRMLMRTLRTGLSEVVPP